MKHFLRPFLITLTALTLAACTDIDEADRYERADRVVPLKNVLIEEFTGQRCVNCPLAADKVEEIRRLYPDNVVAVAIHGGALAVSEERSALGLANAQGEAYTTQRGITSWPKGVVDRSGAPADYEAWGAAVLQRLLVAPRVDLKVTNTVYDATARRLSLTVHTSATANVGGRLQVWLTEDCIVTTQAMPKEWSDAHGGQVYDHAYRADHVFRAAVGNPDGEDVTLHKGDAAEHAFEYTLKEAWNARNVRIVVVFATEDGVEQVVQENIINP